MPRYEYKVVPAPDKGLKGKNIKGAEARFSYGLQELMNGLSGYGWEYQRAETLPSIERAGLTGTTTEWRNVLVFRRLRVDDADTFRPELLPAPDGNSADGVDDGADAETPVAAQAPTSPDFYHSFGKGENGVEDTQGPAPAPGFLGKLAARRNKSGPERTAKADAIRSNASAPKDADQKDP